MSRRTAAARARARRAQAVRTEQTRPRPVDAQAAGSSTRTPRRLGPAQTELAPEDAITIYRDATRYGWTMRLSLAVALTLLIATSAARAAGSPLPVEVGELGLGFMFLFISVTGIKHYRALYRMRKAAVWSNTGRFMLLMAGAPIGAFDPQATRRDRILLRVILVLAALLLVVSIAGGITRR